MAIKNTVVYSYLLSPLNYCRDCILYTRTRMIATEFSIQVQYLYTYFKYQSATRGEHIPKKRGL